MKNVNTEIETKPGYNKTKLGWIPEEWELKKLGKLFEFRNGVNASKEDYGQGIKFVNVMDVLGNTFITEELILGSVQLTEKQIEKNLVKKGDVLFNRTSETQDEIGLTALYNDDAEAVFGGFVIRGRPKNNSLNHQYNGYSFQSELVRKQIVSKGQGAVRVNIGQSDLEQVLFPLPPLPEQKKIAKILSTWDRAIKTLEQLIAKKEELKKGLMQQLLTGKKRFPGFEGEWKEIKIGKFVILQGGYAFKSDTFLNNGIPLIRISNIYNSKISFEENVAYLPNQEISEKYIVSKGDILIAMSGATTGKLGIYNSSKKAFLNQRVGNFIMKNEKVVLKIFLKQVLFHTTFQRSIDIELATGAQPNISSRQIENIKIAIPTDLEEQKKIASILGKLDDEIQYIRAEKERLSLQKKGLMQQLLTGKVRVKI